MEDKSAFTSEAASGADATYVMVLADGETYSSLEGCRILAVPPGTAEDQTLASGVVIYEFDSEPPDLR